MPMDVKQVIVLRTKYTDDDGREKTVRAGKLSAMAAHASVMSIINFSSIAPIYSKDSSGSLNISSAKIEGYLSADYYEWLSGRSNQKKIVLLVDTEDELMTLLKEAAAANLPHVLVTDSGLTEFSGKPTRAAIAIGPAKSEAIDLITKNGRVKTRLA